MSWMKTSTVLLVLVLAVIMITAGCTQTPTTTPTTTAATTVTTPLPTTKIVTLAPPTGNASGIANPASEYCVQVGGNVSIMKDAQGNEYGVCNFPNGTSYDEWALFRGEINGTATNATTIKPVVNKTADVKNATANLTANLTAAKTAANATNGTAK
jgi:putative hemolysin